MELNDPRRPSILIVDDQKPLVALLTSLLSEHYTIRVAFSGEEALQQLQARPVDMVLLDVELPGMSGYEVCREIRSSADLKDIIVIFITGLGSSRDEEYGLQLGADDYILKQISPSLVLKRIAMHFETYDLHHHLRMEISRKNAALGKMQETLLRSLAVAVTYRDSTTGLHMLRTQAYTKLLLDILCDTTDFYLDPEVREQIIQASILHDIGKIAIPDTILTSNTGLTPEDITNIKQHTTLGREILRKTRNHDDENYDFLEIAENITVYHHERWDGSGYPYGLRGTQIPFEARVVGLVDVYDALTGERPYHDTYTHEEAVRIIAEGDGRIAPDHFDPLLLKVFIEHADLFKVAHRTVLSTYSIDT